MVTGVTIPLHRCSPSVFSNVSHGCYILPIYLLYLICDHRLGITFILMKNIGGRKASLRIYPIGEHQSDGIYHRRPPMELCTIGDRHSCPPMQSDSTLFVCYPLNLCENCPFSSVLCLHNLLFDNFEGLQPVM